MSDHAAVRGHRRARSRTDRGLRAPRRLRGAAQGACDDARGGARRARRLRPARPRRRRLPDGQKASFLPKGDMDKYLVCNADESEPGTFKDRELMQKSPHMLIEGIVIAAYAAGSEPRLHLHPRRVCAAGATRSTRALDEARADGYIGERHPRLGHSLSLVVHRGAGAYICGEETGLLDSLEGKRGNPRLKPPFPAIQGLYQGPTLINNVETLATVPHIIAMGGEKYAKLGVAELDRHQARVGLRPRAATGQLRDRARHPLARDHLRPRRRPADGPQGQAVVPRRLELARPDGRRPRPPLRLRLAGQGRLDARLGRDHRRRRLDPGARCRAEAREVLPPRVVRQVHTLPRGHQLDGARCSNASTPARRRRWTSTSWPPSRSTSSATACACSATRWRCRSVR